MKKIGKRSIWISIVVASMFLTGCGNQTGSGDRATGSDAVESVPSTTEVAEEATTEAAIEATVDGSTKPEAVPTSTVSGGKKKAEETTEEKKSSTNSGASNSGSQKPSSGSNSGGSKPSTTEAPKPSSSGNSSNGSSSSGNGNTTPSPKPATPATTEAPTSQHQHVYDQVVVDTLEQRIDYPEQGYYAPAVQCNTCYSVFTSSEEFKAHKIMNGGWCEANGYGSTQVWVKTKDAYTEVGARI